ncbi:MAG: hypothetical protein DRN33_00865 [Thermoplasmata archaeon]|nr:MAG: hypothetical protein DRN33_00865 [Thermoplasmata archaeon]
MSFETFFLGREKIKNPLIEDMISAGKKISGEGEVAISIRFGNRIVITARNAFPDSLTESDFVEIADYDAVRNIALVIGMNEPSPSAAVHWLIYRRDDINAIVSDFRDSTPMKDFDVAMEALKLLKEKRCAELSNGRISVGKSVDEAVEGLKCL